MKREHAVPRAFLLPALNPWTLVKAIGAVVVLLGLVSR